MKLSNINTPLMLNEVAAQLPSAAQPANVTASTTFCVDTFLSAAAMYAQEELLGTQKTLRRTIPSTKP